MYPTICDVILKTKVSKLDNIFVTKYGPKVIIVLYYKVLGDPTDVNIYLFTTLSHPHGHWQLQKLLGNHVPAMYCIHWKKQQCYHNTNTLSLCLYWQR